VSSRGFSACSGSSLATRRGRGTSVASACEDVEALGRLVDQLESGVLTHSPEELERVQEIVDALDADPRAPDPGALARFTCLAGEDA
jgi:hypothetical protein